ncbi:hypothetical protein [Streptomyces sp. SLBN-118]|uniref:hypothetical protein n=1 Tax=Streptomyces sp. SLBN-118 TaxID=2768454 RepID=UPI00114D9414|nr:hypothetical protein [Streptomyces sp. SLBN-118]
MIRDVVVAGVGLWVPAMTAQVVRAAFPKGVLATRVRDAFGEVFADAPFASHPLSERDLLVRGGWA